MGESIAEVAAGLTKAQRTIALWCGDVVDSFPCKLCGARRIRDCGVSQDNRLAAARAADDCGSLTALRTHLISQGADHDR